MNRQEQSCGDELVAEKIELPKLYKVLMHNDDTTTMDFVVHILMKHFGKTEKVAEKITDEIHNKGIALCGIYTFEVAETKTARVLQEAKENDYPLQCTYESE